MQHEYDIILKKYSVAERDLQLTVSLTKQFENVALGIDDQDDDFGRQPTFMTKNDYLDQENTVKLPNLIQTLRVDDRSPRNFVQKVDSIYTMPSVTPLAKHPSVNQSSTLDAHRRANSVITNSYYVQGLIPTENLRLEQFLDIVFGSKMSLQEMKTESLQYMQVIETNCMDKIRSLQTQLEKQRKLLQDERTSNVGKIVERSELEHIFVTSVEEVRKEIIRRRLKNEISLKHISKQAIEDLAEQDFSSSLVKLADIVKSRVKANEFTARDKTNMLDLFVNNEKTLFKIYELIFPGRPSLNLTSQLRSPSD